MILGCQRSQFFDTLSENSGSAKGKVKRRQKMMILRQNIKWMSEKLRKGVEQCKSQHNVIP